MTKAENRAAAKAWHAERQRQMRAEMHQANVAADIEKLREFRWYIMLHRKVLEVDADPLIAAIEAHAERLTGDKHALSLQGHSIP
jgi:hypothetical protein